MHARSHSHQHVYGADRTLPCTNTRRLRFRSRELAGKIDHDSWLDAPPLRPPVPIPPPTPPPGRSIHPSVRLLPWPSYSKPGVTNYLVPVFWAQSQLHLLMPPELVENLIFRTRCMLVLACSRARNQSALTVSHFPKGTWMIGAQDEIENLCIFKLPANTGQIK